jgi:hypothetical protein
MASKLIRLMLFVPFYNLIELRMLDAISVMDLGGQRPQQY